MDGETKFIGVDIQTGKRHYIYASLDLERRLAAIGRGDLTELVSYAAGSPAAWVCVNAPGSLSNGTLAKPGFRNRYQPAPNARQRKRMRVADYELLLQGISPARSYEKRAVPPVWMRYGMALFEQLAGNGFTREIILTESHVVLEGHSEGSYRALLPGGCYPAGSLEGRLQRQVLCGELDLPVADAMGLFEEVTRFRLLNGTLLLDDLHSEGELNALILAFTAWLAHEKPQSIIQLGAPDEGLIHLPGWPLHAPLARQFSLVKDESAP